jgi:hypothetical protein
MFPDRLLETDWLVGAAGFEPLHLRIEFANTLSSGREKSNMRISSKVVVPPPWTSTSGSDSEMQRFESCGSSQPVRLHPLTCEGRSNGAVARRLLRRVWLGLRTPCCAFTSAAEARLHAVDSARPEHAVAGDFLMLARVTACPTSTANSSRPPATGEANTLHT